MFKVYKIKQNKGLFLVVFNDKDKEIGVKLNLEIITKYDLTKDKELSNQIFEEILLESKFIEGFNSTMKFLRTSRSNKEIKNFVEKNFVPEHHSRMLQILKDMGCFNDNMFVQNFIYHYIRKRVGKDYIEKKIFQYGISDEILKEEMKIYTDDLLEENIVYHLERIFRKYKGSKKHFIFKACNFLSAKGFTSSEISGCKYRFREFENKVEEEKYLKQDFEKIIDKYYFIEDEDVRKKGFLNELFKKGYDKDDILKLIKEY